MADSNAIATVRQKFEVLVPIMDERLRRRWAATEAVALGWGGITTVAAATGLSPGTIKAGMSELHAPTNLWIMTAIPNEFDSGEADVSGWPRAIAG